MNNPVKVESRDLTLADKIETTKNFIRKSKSQNTRRAYNADVQDFRTWCETYERDALPSSPETIAIYLADLAERGRKPSTIQRRLSAIKKFHESNGYESPTTADLVKSTLAGIQRELGTAPKQKKPALIEIIRKMVEVLPNDLSGLRDRALVLLGFAGAFRRSELVALDVEDLEFNKGGIVLVLKRSKTDQKGEGMKKAIPYGSSLFTCPVRTLQDWLHASGISTGPIFRSIKKGGKLQEQRLSDKGLVKIIKRTASKAGLNPDDFAGHSLRAGFATQAAINMARFDKIMDQGGWKSEMTVKRYIRDGNLFRNNAAEKLGL